MHTNRKLFNLNAFCVLETTPVPIAGTGFMSFKRLSELQPGDRVYRPSGEHALVIGLTPPSSAALRLHLTQHASLIIGEGQPLRVYDRALKRWRVFSADVLSWRELLRSWKIRHLLEERTAPFGRGVTQTRFGVLDFEDIEPAQGRGVALVGGGAFLVGADMIPVEAADKCA